MKFVARPSLRLALLALCTFVTCCCISGCDEDELKDRERTEIHRIFKTGVDQDDPYVQAETLRVLEVLADPDLDEYAEAAVDDDSPMVRVAAVRVLLSTGHEEARGMVLNRFTQGTKEERRVILSAALEYGAAPLQREITARSLRSSDPQLRRIAFRHGQLARIDEARKAGKTKYLHRTLYPELGRHITAEDPVLAAMALEKFLEVGEDDRAEPMLRKLQDGAAPLEERLVAAKILAGANADVTEDAFLSIIRKHEAIMGDDTLGVPEEVVAPKLLRAAVLGVTAAGNTEYVDSAQDYRKQASEQETLEVLEALGENPSPDAAVALKIAMQDARPAVRHRAIELYQVRQDAVPAALVDAMKGAAYETQRHLASVLQKRFKEEWVAELNAMLKRSSEVDATLALLRNVITEPEQAQAILQPLEPTLKSVAKSEDEGRATLANYLLTLIASSEEASKLASEKLDERTRYAYLEFLTRTAPRENAGLFRRFFYDDLYALRLMSAAGLWRAYAMEDGAETQASDSAKKSPGQEATSSDDEV